MKTIVTDITNIPEAVIPRPIIEDLKILSEIISNPYYKNEELGINS